jgi:hypothetical protein
MPEAQSVAIGSGARCATVRDGAAGSAVIFDDNGLAKWRPYMLGEDATLAAGGVRCLGSTRRRSVGPNPPLVTDTVEKVPKCLLAISLKETKLSYARQLIRHPGRCRSLL